MNKYGQMGEGIFMIYRLLLISLIAFGIFSTSSIFYNYDINIRNAEATILARGISSCLSPNGVLNLDEISEKNYVKILSYCGISNIDRFYVNVDVVESSGSKVARLYEGDSGALWIKELFKEGITEKIEKYTPGYFDFEYPVFILKDGAKIKGNVKMEVLVNYEDK